MSITHTPPDTSTAKRIAAEVRAEMFRQNNMSQRVLAEKLGWHQQFLGRRLTGVVEIRIAELELVAAALGVPVARLLPPHAA